MDEEFALRRIDYGRRLRIGLTDSRAFPRFRGNPNAYVYVDHYDSLEEILAACILSSYVPGLTGPLSERTLGSNDAVRRANIILLNMTEKGSAKNSFGEPVRNNHDILAHHSTSNGPIVSPSHIRFWDGGLANLFPVVDEHTWVITPFLGQFPNPTICPSAISNLPFSKSTYSRPSLCLENLRTIRYIAFSSESTALESWFEKGFNDANAYLKHGETTKASSSFQVMANQALAHGLSEVCANVRPQPTQGL